MSATPAPLVSVFTPAYEIGQHIGTVFRSLVRQTYQNWEWVVLDDSPSDTTWTHLVQIADSADAAGRVRLLRQYPHSGSIGANKAVAAGACHGEFLVEVDHDDELVPEALELVAATFLKYADAAFVYSDWVDWIDNPDGGESGCFPAGWAYGYGAYATEVVGGRRVQVALTPPMTSQTVRHIVSTPNHLRAWRASFYRAIAGHDPDLRIGDDYDLVVRSLLAGQCVRIPRPLYIQHHDRGGANTSRQRNAAIQAVVQSVAEGHRTALDERCAALGPEPQRTSPLTDALPIRSLNADIDVLAERDEDRGEPLISVVMPTFRRPSQLTAAISSVLRQSYRNIELLVVGDQCPHVDAVLSDFDDPRIRTANLARHCGDGGAGPRNFALKRMARGTLVAYLDDDNTWTNDHLESLVSLFCDEPGLAFAFSSFSLHTSAEDEGEVVDYRVPRRYQIDTSALLHRRWLLDRYGYWRPNAEADWAHDWDLVARWTGEAWAASGRPTLRYTLGGGERAERIREAVRGVASEVAGT
ncbi:glycosyltransferase family 2 protein [Hoyosella altamirensis]|uniref:glycosyltransferase family 2 protein n=1 Tax=Hoyosella altamirensis TaxID=616997 RepID=UPI0007DB1D02|nr:glycosyltransferase [Hoyosella altamirensis]